VGIQGIRWCYFELPTYASVNAFSVCAMFPVFDILICEGFLIAEVTDHVYIFK
jgi:hypothetical protein